MLHEMHFSLKPQEETDMPLDPENQKEIMKAAIREWLDDAFAEFGKWTLKGILALAFCGCVYLAMKGQGWHR